jgi:hypothetical protein
MKPASRTAQSNRTVTWELLTTLEPRLNNLLAEVRYAANDRESASFCTCRLWYFDLKPRLLPLVGWHRRPFHPVLSTERAYDVAYRALYDALPLCGNCPWCDEN